MTRMNLVIQYLRFQLFREKLYRLLRMLCRCLPWMILLWMILPLDACPSSMKSCRRRRSLSVKCAMQISKELWWCMSTLIFLPPRPFLISLSRKCSEKTFVISVSLNFVLTSLRIFCSGIRFERPQVQAPQVWAPHILVPAPRAASLCAPLNKWLNELKVNVYLNIWLNEFDKSFL